MTNDIGELSDLVGDLTVFESFGSAELEAYADTDWDESRGGLELAPELWDGLVTVLFNRRHPQPRARGAIVREKISMKTTSYEQALSARLACVAMGTIALLACREATPLGAEGNPPSEASLFNPFGAAKVGERVTPKSLRVRFSHVSYVVIPPASEDVAKLLDRIKAAFAVLDLQVSDFDPAPTAPRVTLNVVPSTDFSYAIEILHLKGRGVERDAEPLAGATHGVEILVAGPSASRGKLFTAAGAVASEVAEACGGWILDTATSETFGREAFAERRMRGVSDVAALSTVHMVAEDDGDGVFLQTFGLERQGVPELLVRHVPRAMAEDVNTVLSAAANCFHDGQGIGPRGKLHIDVARFEGPKWREVLDRARTQGGDGQIDLTATWAANTLPDASPLIELSFGSDRDVLAEKLKRAVGYTPDEALLAPADDPSLVEASRRAREALLKLAPRFVDGVPSGQRLSVKSPFKNSEGVAEWIWVEVTAWKGDTMSGILANEPWDVAGRHLGAKVEVKASESFDFNYTDQDGTKHGGETERLLQRYRSSP